MKKVLTIITCFIFLAGLSDTFAQLLGQVPLKPNKIPQFVDPLPHFAGLRVDATTGSGNLTVTAKQKQQIAVSTGTKLATGTVGVTPGIGFANLWAYEISYDGRTVGPFWPAYTIETRRGFPLNVTYINDLKAPDGLSQASYSDVGLVVDQTLHWADPLMQMPQMGIYYGEVPITVHLHGGEVPPLSDGGPDSWFTPGNLKTGHSFNGTGTTANPYLYPNTQEGATLWFHDHALGVTRLNVYAGMAGFYFLRGSATEEDNLHLPGWSGDDLVREAAGGFRGTTAYLPEIEIVIQDRMFDDTGNLYFPNLPTNPLVHPTWTPEFVGDVITVNGKTWPYLSVAPRKYRFRLLNGSNARFYELSFGNGANKPVITQIGTDGGFLDAPVPIVGKLVLAPGERADVVIDFTAFAGQSFILDNTARTPYPGGAPANGNTTGKIMKFVVNGTMVDGPDLDLVAADNSIIQNPLKTNVKLTNFAGAPATGVPVVKTRQLTLNEVMGPGGPLEVLVNNTKWSGLQDPGTGVLQPRAEGDFTSITNGTNITYYSETMEEGTTEIWKIINLTADAHPIHLHLVQFQLMSRQPFNVAGYNAVYNAAFPGGLFIGGYGPPKAYDTYATGPNPIFGGNPDVTPNLIGAPLPANPNERGWKDTFIMYPGEVTTVIARWAPTDKAADLNPTNPLNEMWFPFDPNGGHGYVWHCHIIDHEDNEMMRPYNVNPNNARLAKAGTTIAENLPNSFELSQNYPNPFNPSTVINFSVPKENTLVTLKVYNSLGEEVGTLINQVVPAGQHQVNFNARGLSSGVYFYTLTAGNFVDSKKMVVMK